MVGAYLVLGEERSDADAKIAALLAASPATKAETRFGFDAEDVDRTISDLETPSLFSQPLFIVIESAEQLTERNAAALSKRIKSGACEGTIVFRSEQNRLSRHIEDAVPKSNRFVFYLMFESRKPQYVKSVLGKLGRIAENAAIEELLDLVDGDKSSIMTACRRLVQSLPDEKRPISVQDVSRVLDYDRDEDAIELFSHLSERNLKAAVKASRRAVMARRSLSPVISALLGYVRRASAYMRNVRDAVSEPWKADLVTGPITIRYPAEKDFIKAFASYYTIRQADLAQCILISGERMARSGLDANLQAALFEKDLARMIRS